MYLLRKKKLLCQTFVRMDREGKNVMTLAQFRWDARHTSHVTRHTSHVTRHRQVLHAVDALAYLDILSPSWKRFVTQNDHQAKVDIERLVTVQHSP